MTGYSECICTVRSVEIDDGLNCYSMEVSATYVRAKHIRAEMLNSNRFPFPTPFLQISHTHHVSVLSY